MRTRRRKVLAAGVALVAAAGVISGVLATGGSPAVPTLHMNGIAEDPCAPESVLTVPVSVTGQFVPDSSVLTTAHGVLASPGTAAGKQCVATAVAASTEWLDSGTIPGTAAQRGLAARALLDLRLSVRPDGAVVAGFYGDWDYTWPRDSSWVAVALADTGHGAQALSILRFLQRMQPADGIWAARYYPDGSGEVSDGRPAELDGVGWVPWAVWSWAQHQDLTAGSPARAELEQLWPMVTKAADAAASSLTSDGLPVPAMDYWEDSVSVTLGTAAPLLAGLRSAASLAATLGDSVHQSYWESAADRLSAAITATFGRTGYQRTLSAGSGADTAVTFLGPPFAKPGQAVLAAAKAAQRELTEPNGGLRPGTAWPGAAGVAWTPETAMFALFDAGTGQPAAAQRLLSWLAAHRTSLGELPEQVNAAGDPVSVAPLAWTDAIVLLTLLAESGQVATVPAHT
ncbi:MAG TPA: glycoside hydrolase family 15 [Streptosporangiaceae bacterium]|nr:glycoside hydrolase family 15 [Streptosporangiaceae bacterium]